MLSDEEILELIDTARDGTPAWWTGPELEAVLRAIVEAKERRMALLDDVTLTVGGPGTYDPPAESSSITLPEAWVGKRLRLSRNGGKYHAYTRTSTGITLTIPGDVTLPGETFSFENY